MSILLSLEGVNLRSGYIVRELAIFFPAENGGVRTFYFATPEDLELTHLDRRTNYHHRHSLNGANLDVFIPGALCSTLLHPILKSLATYKIYVAGNVAQNFLQSLLPYTVVEDICKKFGFKYPKRVPHQRTCGLDHSGRYCAASKLNEIVQFMD